MCKPKLENSKDSMSYQIGQHQKYLIHANDYEELRMDYLFAPLLNYATPSDEKHSFSTPGLEKHRFKETCQFTFGSSFTNEFCWELQRTIVFL